MTEQPPCESLPWDTEFFGRRIARVVGHCLGENSVPAIASWCDDHKIECLYFLSDCDDDATEQRAKDFAFLLVDERITLEQQVTAMPSPPPLPQGTSIRLAKEQDVAALQKIAESVHTDTRFFHDPNFHREDSRRLYATWIAKSCRNENEAVWLATDGHETLGYFVGAMDENSKTGRIGLVGIAAHAQGRGIGSALMLSALRWFADEGATRVEVVTQRRNEGALRLYERYGFVTKSIRLWYHRWWERNQ